METAKLIRSLKYPDFERDTQFMSIVKDDEFECIYINIENDLLTKRYGCDE